MGMGIPWKLDSHGNPMGMGIIFEPAWEWEWEWESCNMGVGMGIFTGSHIISIHFKITFNSIP